MYYNTKVMTLVEQMKLIEELTAKTLPSVDSQEEFYSRNYVNSIEEHENIDNDAEKLMSMGWALVRGGLSFLERAAEVIEDEEHREDYGDSKCKANERFFEDLFKREITNQSDVLPFLTTKDLKTAELNICKNAARVCKIIYNIHKAQAYQGTEGDTEDCEPLDCATIAIATVLLEKGYGSIGFRNFDTIKEILEKSE